MAGIAAVFKALSNPNRLAVFQIICRAAEKKPKGLTIEEICKEARMKQPAVSHHVAHLERAGLIDRTKDRWWVHCTPNEETLRRLAAFAKGPADFAEE
jgi:DNA-binding transcriptional ArsR family regulator